MTSRPITARPKTSAGTRATSARLRKPSIHGSQYDVAERRPISRAAAMMSESMVPTTVSRPVSRIGSIQPSRLNSSTRNERIRSRIGGTGQGVKLITDTIQIAPCRTVTRPVTQQGLTGVRPSTRIVAGRFVVDKSYYMSLLRAQMNNLISEIDTLRGDLNKGERDRQNLLIYERRAEEEANIIRTLQGRFLDCNKIVDLINTNSELYEIEDELSKLYEQRNDAEKSLAELVKDRHMKEENIRKIENEIEEQKARNNAIFHSMNSAINDAYEELKKKNQELLKEYQMKQQVLNELNQKKEQFDEHLAKFPLKQQATVLYEQLAELEEKKLIIVDEIHAEGTPDEQREHLLQIVIRTTDEINVIQKQLDDVNEQIEQLMEESHEFDIEMENAAGEKNEKYRELKLKEMQIDEFLNSYDNLMAEEELRINEISTEIIHILTLISTNITNLCLSSQNTNLDLTELRINENVSASTLKELYVYLQKELVEMDKLEEYLKTDNNQIGERIKEIDEKMKMFGSINDLKSHMEQKHQMKNTEKKWQSVEKNLDALRELAIQREMETNYEVFKKEALRLKAEYNVALIASMKLC
ncbi:Intraflagellar transport protein [Dirofilaria immitis]